MGTAAMSNRIPLCAAGHCALPAPTRLAAFIVYEESFIVLSLTSLMIPFFWRPDLRQPSRAEPAVSSVTRQAITAAACVSWLAGD